MSNYEKFFKSADTDNSGYLTLPELTSVLVNNGYDQKQAKGFFDAIDREFNDKVSFEEFMIAMGQRDPKTHKQAAMRRVFRSFDENGDGKINKAELKQIYKELGTDLTDAELNRVMSSIDNDHSGGINYEEFVDRFF